MNTRKHMSTHKQSCLARQGEKQSDEKKKKNHTHKSTTTQHIINTTSIQQQSNNQPNHTPQPPSQHNNSHDDRPSTISLRNLPQLRRIIRPPTPRSIITHTSTSRMIRQRSLYRIDQITLNNFQSAQLLANSPRVVPSYGFRGRGGVGEPDCAAGDAVGAACAGVCGCHGGGGEVGLDE
jgi:hypothetical protein